MKKRIATTISVFEFMQLFPTEKAAREFFIFHRWGDEIKCPHCNHNHISILKREGFFRCKNRECRKVFSAKTGTVMANSKLDIRVWLLAICSTIVTARKSVSSLQFSKEVGVTQKTAWFLLHRVREGMKIGDSDLNAIFTQKEYSKIMGNRSVGQFLNDMADSDGIKSVWMILKRAYHGIFYHFSKKHFRAISQ